MAPKKSSKCTHPTLQYTPSRNAAVAGYKRPTYAQRIAASTVAGRSTKEVVAKATKVEEEKHALTFPGPLVLPEDELAYDPKCPSQSVRSWTLEKHRNELTNRRRTVYFVGPPDSSERFEGIQRWANPQIKLGAKEKLVEHPTMPDCLSYLKAFYHGLPVKMLETPRLHFTADSEIKETTKTPRNIWLNTGSKDSLIGIRIRPSPEKVSEYTHQLNLNDLLDAAIEMLPNDAYALLMLVQHDIYDDDDDDFACGTAYGGSRVAVVSSARYNPLLDKKHGVDREHSWPASHCVRWMEEWMENFENMDVEELDGRVVKALKLKNGEREGAIEVALTAHMSLPPVATSQTALYELWLGRVCRTAAHELGHCFGIAHCTYYACSMQATASIIEDPRQPPYLCPVDLEKVLKATGAEVKDRYRALLKFCEKHEKGHLFKAYGAWIEKRLSDLNEEESVGRSAETAIGID